MSKYSLFSTISQYPVSSSVQCHIVINGYPTACFLTNDNVLYTGNPSFTRVFSVAMKGYSTQAAIIQNTNAKATTLISILTRLAGGAWFVLWWKQKRASRTHGFTRDALLIYKHLSFLTSGIPHLYFTWCDRIYQWLAMTELCVMESSQMPLPVSWISATYFCIYK